MAHKTSAQFPSIPALITNWEAVDQLLTKADRAASRLPALKQIITEAENAIFQAPAPDRFVQAEQYRRAYAIPEQKTVTRIRRLQREAQDAASRCLRETEAALIPLAVLNQSRRGFALKELRSVLHQSVSREKVRTFVRILSTLDNSDKLPGTANKTSESVSISAPKISPARDLPVRGSRVSDARVRNLERARGINNHSWASVAAEMNLDPKTVKKLRTVGRNIDDRTCDAANTYIARASAKERGLKTGKTI